MNKALLSLFLMTTLVETSLIGRELMCEQCEPQEEPCCPEHLFVERSQIYFSAEFLYWAAYGPSLDYAIHRDIDFPDQYSLAVGKYKTASYDFRPGFRAGIAYYRCPRYWEVNAEYTWFYDAGHNHSVPFVKPTKFTFFLSPFEKVSSSLQLHYHVGDLYVYRVFDPNPHLRLRLLGGITLAYLKQKWEMDYVYQINGTETSQEKWRFFGGGLRIGLRGDWYWGCQFYLTGKATFASLYGNYHNQTTQTVKINNTEFGNAKFEDNRLAVHTQFMLGPSWQIPCDCWSFELFAGYELNTWCNVHERINVAFPTFAASDATQTVYGGGLFATQGLTLRLNLGF